MLNNSKHLITLALMSLSFTLVKEVGAIENKNSKEITKIESVLDKLTTSFSSTLSTDTKQIEDSSKVVESEFEIISTYKFSASQALRARLGFAKGLTQGREESLANTNLTFITSEIYHKDALNISSVLGVILPTNKDTRVIEGLNIALEASAVAAYKFSEAFSLVYIPRVTRNFHKYTTALNGSNNIENRLTQIFSLGYTINDNVSLGQTIIYANSWSYYGTSRDPGYVSISQVSYNLNQKLSLSVGISNGGAIFNTQYGPDQRIEIFDQNTSNYFTSLQLVL